MSATDGKSNAPAIPKGRDSVNAQYLSFRRLMTDADYCLRVQGVRILTEAGWSVSQIARFVGLKPRQIKKDRQAIRRVQEAAKAVAS